MRNIVFLYTEIAPYFLACCRELAQTKNVKIHIVRYPVNNEAPFLFGENGNDITFYDRKKYTKDQLAKLVRDIDPTVIICSGWIDKDYLAICRQYHEKIPTVLTLDTHWRGDMKQRLATLVAPFYLHKRFSHAWVPGHIQKNYALKLGFKDQQIRLGFYSADVEHFSLIYEKINKGKQEEFPKRLIYVGRYYEFKGVTHLWKAFSEIQEETPNEWELWCLGTGDLKPAEHPKIKHFGFVQPADMLRYVKDTGVFVMPSLFEPWGVVLHEFATMGFPLVISDKVGAAEVFLKNGMNGYSYPAGKEDALKEKLKTIMSLTTEQLTLMGSESRKLAFNITPRKWADTVVSFI